MIDWDLITREKCYGTLKGLCCLSVEQMWLLKTRIQNASLSEVQEFHRYICECNGASAGSTTTGTPETPATQPGGCQGAECNCTATLKKYCADTAWKGKLTAYAAAMATLIGAMAPTILSPGGAAAVSALKDYVDAIYALMKICVTGEATKDTVADFCSQHSAARAVVEVVPGVSTVFGNLESLLEPILKACCADWDKPVPVGESSKFTNDWGNRDLTEMSRTQEAEPSASSKRNSSTIEQVQREPDRRTSAVLDGTSGQCTSKGCGDDTRTAARMLLRSIL